MSEVCLDIHFSCEPEHKAHWKTVFHLLVEGKRGWQLQDAVDPISKTAADNLDDVWDNLPHGSDSFEVFIADVKKQQCHLQLMTGGMVIEALVKYLIPWFKECAVSDLRYQCSGDDE